MSLAMNELMQQTIERLYRLPLITMAVVTGGAIGGLVALVGRKKALLWMAGGYRLTAQECIEGGLADLIVEKDSECLNASLLYLKPFLVDDRTGKRVSPNAVRGMKQLISRQMKEDDGDFEKKIFAGTAFSKL